jgi:hypothetical protein
VSFCLRARAPQRVLAAIQESPDLQAFLEYSVLPFVFSGMRSVNAKGAPPCADAFSVNAHSHSATLDHHMSKAMEWNASYNMPVFFVDAFQRSGRTASRGANQPGA